MTIKEIIRLAHKYFYFSVHKGVNDKAHIRIGSSGSILLENLKNEWIFSNVTNRDLNISLYMKQKSFDKNDLISLYNENKVTNGSNLPFGIATITVEKNDANLQKVENIDYNYLTTNGSEYFTKLRTVIYLNPNDKMKFFHHLQRQRKLWWKKV